MLVQVKSDSSIQWPIEAINKAEQVVEVAATEIQRYYYRQIRLLRQIPYLALEADGRGGWQDNYSRAYCICMYPIHQAPRSGPYDLFIDLRRGHLITNLGHADVPMQMAKSSFIYEALAREKPFDPIALANILIEQGKGEYHNKPDAVEKAIAHKVVYKQRLDTMMDAAPLETIINELEVKGIKVE